MLSFNLYDFEKKKKLTISKWNLKLDTNFYIIKSAFLIYIF